MEFFLEDGKKPQSECLNLILVMAPPQTLISLFLSVLPSSRSPSNVFFLFVLLLLHENWGFSLSSILENFQPALSIGNVGQLALDLLISSLKAERIGYLDDPCVLPCVGNDAYVTSPEGILALPLQAYASPSDALTLVQQRSPIAKLKINIHEQSVKQSAHEEMGNMNRLHHRWMQNIQMLQGSTQCFLCEFNFPKFCLLFQLK